MMIKACRGAVIVLCVCTLGACGRREPDATETPSIAVTAVQPIQRAFPDTLAAVGSVIANPRAVQRLSVAHVGTVVSVRVSAGEAVRAGQAIFEIAAAPAARQAFAEAKTALALAQRQLTHVSQLAAQHLATTAQVDVAQSGVADARAAFNAQRALGGDKATETVMAKTVGVITHVDVVAGQQVPANAVLATLVPSGGLVVELGVPADDATRIRVGMPVVLHAIYGGLPDMASQVSVVGHAVDPATRLVPVQVAMPSAWSTRVTLGSAASGEIKVANFTAWAVPRGALQGDEENAYLFQIEKGHAQRVDVKVLAPAGSPVGVTGPLDPHAPVITLGSHELSAGEAVRVAASLDDSAPR